MAQPRHVQSDLIVRTKLNRPPPPADLVPRERLVDLLQSNPDRSLTLVSAPAGYGKSTLVARWLDLIDVPGVYLSLDAEDDEPRIFLRYFIEAVRMHSPSSCRRTHELLGAAELPPPSLLGDYLVNDLLAIKRPFILVVDDYHRIHAQAVHEMIDQLLRHPCRSFHLVLVPGQRSHVRTLA